MSGDQAADAEDPDRLRFILMLASETFDGKERVMSRAAYALQITATAHSASCGHPGFVPDDYLEHLDGSAVRPPSRPQNCAAPISTPNSV
jgi:hypothetical protein